MIEIRPVKNREELQQVFNIRRKVFVEEQKVDPAIEFDGMDDRAEHIVMLFNGTIVGCARIRYIKSRAKLERIAILREYREKGFGKRLMDFLILHCKKKGLKEIYLHSQIAVKDFYRNIGFIERGEIFFEAEIPHVEMYMELS